MSGQELSLPVFHPDAGRVGRLLEGLPVGQASRLSPSSLDKRDACPTIPLPMSLAEARERGWDELDVVIVTGDAYIDHPSFAMAILGRVLEAGGYRVGIISQPDWRRVDDWRRFGKPRLFFAISAGNMDSMINHYTANRKVRNERRLQPGGRIGLRPDRATLAYCQRAREAYRGVPVIAGGVEASLRRLAHYDYWNRQGPPLDPAGLQGRPGRLRHGRARHRGDYARLARGSRLRDMRGAMRCATCAAGVAYRAWARGVPPPTDRLRQA